MGVISFPLLIRRGPPKLGNCGVMSFHYWYAVGLVPQQQGYPLFFYVFRVSFFKGSPFKLDLYLFDFDQLIFLQGARLVVGGGRVDCPGLYMEPTIFCDVEECHTHIINILLIFV